MSDANVSVPKSGLLLLCIQIVERVTLIKCNMSRLTICNVEMI